MSREGYSQVPYLSKSFSSDSLPGNSTRAEVGEHRQIQRRLEPTLTDLDCTDLDRTRQRVLHRVIKEGPTDRAPLPEAMHPEEAMKLILQHVHFDPDGGLMNLSNTTGQASKVEALQKGPLETLMAFVFLFRCVLNVTKVFHFAGFIVLTYVVEEDYIAHLNERYMNVNLPGISNFGHTAHLVVGVAVVEVVAVTFVSLSFLRELLFACCESGPSRFVRLSRCVLRDMPRLASLSAMRAMAWIHPNLLVKHSKDFDLRERCARAMMERFLKANHDDLTDSEITIQAAKIIFSKDPAYIHSSNEEKVDLANGFIDESQPAVFAALCTSFGRMGVDERGDLLKEFNVDHGVLDLAWRLTFVNFVELSLFVFVTCVMAAVGAGGLLAKLADGSVVLTTPEEPPHKIVFWIMAFWNQLVSIMAINDLLFWRIQTFIFGGCDARVSVEEHFIISTYLGHLLQKIWENDRFSFMSKVAITLKLDDDDLQQLVVEEDQSSKNQVLASVKRHMRDIDKTQGVQNPFLKWMKAA